MRLQQECKMSSLAPPQPAELLCTELLIRATKTGPKCSQHRRVFTSLSNGGGKPKLQEAAGGRSAHSGYSSSGSEGEQLRARKTPAWRGHKDQVIANLQGKVSKSPPVSGDPQATAELLSIRADKTLTKLLWALALLRAATLERGKGQPAQSRTCP